MTPFITFEGIEGSGKTTQIRLLGAHLKRLGHGICLTREPGGCAIGDQIRRVLLHPDNSRMAARTELLLYAAARAQHVAEVIGPELEKARIVLCDRFSDATLAYQGDGRKLDRQLIGQLNELASGGYRPDLTLLFDLPVEIGLQRALLRETERQDSSEGRFEREALAFHQRIRDGYLALAAAEPQRIRVIDATADSARISSQVIAIVDEFLHQRTVAV